MRIRWHVGWDHPPHRPDWTCARCGAPWPCRPAKARLRREYAGAKTILGMYLAGHLGTAYRDLPHADRGGLYHRFVGWSRS